MNETLECIAQEAERSASASASERPRRSGFVIKPIDKDAALAMLNEFLQNSDPEEDRETLNFLMQAIDEQRAAIGARLLFDRITR